MPIPKFNKFGILPNGIHECTLNEVENQLGSINDHRKQRWKDFIRYFKKLVNANIAKSIYIDGSFVTDKPDPTDIDIVVELRDGAFINTNSDVAKELFNSLNNQVIYRLHVFPHMNSKATFKNDFREYFQYIKPDEAKKRGMSNQKSPDRNYYKGILKVTL